MSSVVVVIGAGQIGQAIARRVGVAKHGQLGLVDVDFKPKPALAEWDRAFARPLRPN
jgi:malate/lactate dehydrogenase